MRDDEEKEPKGRQPEGIGEEKKWKYRKMIGSWFI